ncbi:MAG: 16S rRNA (cytosine(1402)-N(4))-methyltransferase RsmH [Myxococcales bacterium]
MTQSFDHASVMCRETLQALAPRSGGFYADATAGGGGHSAAILEASAPDGRLVAVDRDPRAVEAARARLAAFGDRAVVVHGAYADLGPILRQHGAGRVDGLVADLGVSSPQLDDAERGFSFAAEGPLDMRMDTSGGETLAELLDRVGEAELADILYHYGEERRSRAVARSIMRARDAGELRTTLDLRRAVVRVLGPKRGRVDPATRTFQALRIALNRELDQLEQLLSELPELLQDDGVAAIISFHSLEDRMVKRAFRGDDRLSPLTKRPLQAGELERSENPRARSAKLRAARRVPRTSEVNA